MRYLSFPEPVSPDSPLRYALKRAIDVNEVEVPVVEGRKLLGVVDLRPFILPTTDLFNAKVRNLMVKYPTASEASFTPLEAMAIMAGSGVRGVPVVGEGGEYVGMFYHRNALDYVNSQGFGSGVPVLKIMRGEVPVVSPRDRLAKAAAVMRRLKAARVVVVDEDLRPVGILTRTDLLRVAFTYDITRATVGELAGEKYRLLERKVHEYMSRNPVVVDVDASVREALKLMLDHDVRGIPVVSRQELVGLVVSTDIIRLFVSRRAPAPARGRYLVDTNVEELRLGVERILSMKRLPPGVDVRVGLYKRRGNRYEVHVALRSLNRVVTYSDMVHSPEKALNAVRTGVERCRAKFFDKR